ncbi:CBS domain-containing protein [Desertibaculum subflavum]|uniref:CBS domain-containing protein n=1 Tax=Desertibaculum subflavum TaxID=2268458 RepID=UPI000E668D81
MQAKHVMTTAVAVVRPDTAVREVARVMLERRVSGVPVMDEAGRVLGMVSESDLMRRPESGTERHPSWWLSLLASPEERAMAYVKSHGGCAGDVMTRSIVFVTEETSLEEIAGLLEKHRIKRVPVLRDGKLVGIVSRADLLHGLVARQAPSEGTADDHVIKENATAAISEAGVNTAFISIVVLGGAVHLWGAVESDAEKKAARIAAESVAGVKSVRDEIGVLPPSVRAVLWAD